MSVEFSFDATKYVAGLKGMAERTPQQVAGKLYVLANTIMTDAKENYVPHDKGLLAASGAVDVPIVLPGFISVRMHFGGPSEPYALAIHEHLSEHSPPSWQVAEESGSGVHFSHGGPKYLERPVMNHSGLLPVAAGEGFLAAVRG